MVNKSDKGHIDLISVALIVSNRIELLIDNILEQDYEYKEIIIINNNSNLTKAANYDPPARRMVSIYDTEANYSLGSCLNLAMFNSSAAHFIYWDSIYNKERLSRLKQAIDDYKSGVVIPTDNMGNLNLRNCLIKKHQDLFYLPIDQPFRPFYNSAKNKISILYLPLP